ncbi:MAG: hypothetical protein J0H48_03145 [Nitrosospira multiformis]|nr:hypothetical protein [Nitrosospira multiformis]
MAGVINKIRFADAYPQIIVFTLLIQLVLVSSTFPLGELLTATPLYHIDAPHHWYQITVAAALAQQGYLIGYDPFFAAGYVGGIPFNTSAKAPAAVAALLSPWISPAIAFKLFSFSCAVFSPAALPLAARSLGLRANAGLLAALLAIGLWWVSPIRWYHTAGIVAWPFATFCALWFAASAVAYVTGRVSVWNFGALAIFGAVLFFVHPLFPIAAAFALMPLLWIFRSDIISGRLFALLIFLPLVCTLLNLPWILTILKYPGMANGMQPYQQVIDINMVWQDMLGMPSGGRGSKLYFLLFFFALWGVFGQSEKYEKRLSTALLLMGICTVIFADVGAAIPGVAVIAPNRFSFQAYILMVLPAALGVMNVVRAIQMTGASRAIGTVSTAFGAVALVFFLNDIRREITPGAYAHHGHSPPEVRELGPLTRWAIEQLGSQTDASARVMFELSHARIHDGGHMAGFLAVQSNREFIGGAYPYTHFANFWDNWMFGQPVTALPIDRFREYVTLYNIGWILVHSDTAKSYLAAIPDILLVAENGPLALYRIETNHTFFLQGKGEVVGRGMNRLEISNLEGDAVVLKYHYIPGMLAEPPVEIDGVKILDDPEPFIRITRPPAHTRLRLYLP